MGDLQESAPTFEVVWAMFKETDKKFQEMTKQFKERDKKLEESTRETKKAVREVAKENQELIRSLKEFSEESRAIGRRMDQSKRELDRRMGDLSNRFGELAEHLVAPSINEKFNLLGYQFDAIAPGGWRIDDPATGEVLAEIDLLLQNAESMVAVEVKAKPREQDIADHIRRLGVLRAWADRHGDRRRIHGALAGAIVTDSLRRQVVQAGLYLIVQTGDTMKIDVPDGFIPRRW
jgi:hypothetical protein